MSAKQNPVVVTIIVHYNAPEECIAIVKQLNGINYSNHHIVIVDNPSTPEVYNTLRQNINNSKVHIIQNVANNGYGAGINFGANYAQELNPDYYHIINTDTSIINADYIDSLVKEFESNPSAGLIGPAVVTPTGEIQNTIMSFPSVTNAILFKWKPKNLSTIAKHPKTHLVEVINGVCFMVKAKAFQQIGGFDEDFFMYGEEHDFCFRLKQAGFHCLYWSGSSIEHQSGHNLQPKTITWRDVLTRANQVQFIKKHRSAFEAYLLALIFTFFTSLKKILGYSLHAPLLKTISYYFNPKVYNHQFQSKKK